MGRNGTPRISALKSQTGILSNNLTDHAPSGHDLSTGTFMSDFLISAIGRDAGVNGWQTDLERVGQGTLAQGISGHDTFEVLLEAQGPAGGAGNEFWTEQCAVGGSALDIVSPTGDATLLSKTKTGQLEVTLEYEVTGVNDVRTEITLTGLLNNDATNHGVSLVYDSANDPNTDVWSTAPRTWQVEWSTSGTDMAFTAYPYDPQNQVNDFWVWDADPNSQLGSPNGTTQGNNSSQQVIAQFDYTNFYSSGDTFTMEIVYEDQNSNVQDTVSFDVSAGSTGSQLFNGLS